MTDIKPNCAPKHLYGYQLKKNLIEERIADKDNVAGVLGLLEN